MAEEGSLVELEQVVASDAVHSRVGAARVESTALGRGGTATAGSIDAAGLRATVVLAAYEAPVARVAVAMSRVPDDDVVAMTGTGQEPGDHLHHLPRRESVSRAVADLEVELWREAAHHGEFGAQHLQLVGHVQPLRVGGKLLHG